MPGGVPLDFSSLAVRVTGEAPAALAASLQADWQRQTVNWQPTHELHVSVLKGTMSRAGRSVTAQTQNGPLEFLAEGEQFSTAGLSLETAAHDSRMALSEEVSPAALLLAFSEVQRAAGLLPLHASVLSRDGQTAAISGPSGAGKSTAALRLLGRGWQLLAEDWAWLHPATLQLVGWDGGLRLRPESLKLFAPELLNQAPTDEHGKKVLNPPRLRGPRVLNALYFLSAAPGPSRTDLVRAVWSMVGVPLTPAARQATQAGVNTLMAGLPMQHRERNDLTDLLH